jgi:hypothetical protein
MYIINKILRVEHQSYVALTIRDYINVSVTDSSEEEEDSEKTNSVKDSNASNKLQQSSFKFGHIYMGSRQQSYTLSQLETNHRNDPAFNKFCTRLNVYLNNQQILQQTRRRVTLAPYHSVCLE